MLEYIFWIFFEYSYMNFEVILKVVLKIWVWMNLVMVGGLYCVVEFVELSWVCGGGNNVGNVVGKIDVGGG